MSDSKIKICGLRSDADVKLVEGADQRFVGAWTFEKKVEQTSEGENNPQSEEQAEERTTTDVASIASTVEETPSEVAPSATEPIEISREVPVETKGGSKKAPIIVVAVVVALGVGGFVILRKKNGKKEDQ